MASLPDLPNDALLHLLCPEFLSARDVAALACTCRLLRSCARQDAVWRAHCEAWLAQRAGQADAGIPRPLSRSPAALLAALRLPTHRALYTALHALGSWPEGLFYATSEAAQPRGDLQLGRLDGEGGCLRLVGVRPGDVVGPPARAEDAWRLSTSLSIVAAPSDDGSQASVTVRSGGGLYCSLELALDGQTLSVHSSFGRQQAQSAPSCRIVPPSETQEPGAVSSVFVSMAAYFGGSRQPHVESKRYCRVPLPSPLSMLPAPGEPPGMALLRRCQGVFFGSYGPHGLEVLSLSACGARDEAPPDCPIDGLRLQALKLTGDPNVPALRHSFVVDASSCRLGPYDPTQDDPFAPEGGPPRPCLSFWVGTTQLVNLQERPVAARFRAAGCINVVPGQWDPQWVPASFLLYHPPMERVLTVVFEDEDQPFRHAIDYHEFPYAATAATEG
ncbi:hypothetical protein ABPG77_010838 [Micractinium sp. CCAP 211/92]